MAQRGAVIFVGAEHANELADDLRLSQLGHRSQDRIGRRILLDREMTICE